MGEAEVTGATRQAWGAAGPAGAWTALLALSPPPSVRTPRSRALRPARP